MNKTDIINSLQDARIAHKKWIGYANKLLDGYDLEYVQAPLKCNECEFGLWFYSAKGQVVKRVPGANKIEHQHYLFHEYYEVLYHAAPQVHRSKGIFSSAKHQAEQSEQLLSDYNKLKTQSEILLETLEQVEKLVTAMPEKLFKPREAKR